MNEKKLIEKNNEKPTSNENLPVNEINDVLTDNISHIFDSVLGEFRVTSDKKIKMITKSKETCIHNGKILNELIKQSPLSITYDHQQNKIKTTRNNKTYEGDCIGNKELENRIKEGGHLTITFENNLFNFDYEGNRFECEREYGPDKYYDPSDANQDWINQIILTPPNGNKNWSNPTIETQSLLSGLSKLIWGISPLLPNS